MNAIINHLIEELENIQHGSPWVGSTYERKLKSIDSDLVFKRPNNIIDLHCAGVKTKIFTGKLKTEMY